MAQYKISDTNVKIQFELGGYYKVYNDDSFEIFRFTGYDPPRGYIIGKGELPLSEILKEHVYIEFIGHELE